MLKDELPTAKEMKELTPILAKQEFDKLVNYMMDTIYQQVRFDASMGRYISKCSISSRSEVVNKVIEDLEKLGYKVEDHIVQHRSIDISWE